MNLSTCLRSAGVSLDFTKYTPQAQGNSFGGRDGRFNTITIDGAAFNNNFGLSSNPLPGGEAQPIALDAIEEISVSMAPYDVRMSQFTGASINAVTRSGDNSFKASVYTYIRPESFTGNTVDGNEVTGAKGEKLTEHRWHALAVRSSRTNCSSSSAENMEQNQFRVLHGNQVQTV